LRQVGHSIQQKKLLNQMGAQRKGSKMFGGDSKKQWGNSGIRKSKRNPYEAARQGLVMVAPEARLVMGVANEGLIKREEYLSQA
jgi:hypothetical protein